MKKFFTFLSLMLTVSVILQAATVAQWKFNDGNWTTTKSQITRSSNWTISKNNNGVETDARNIVATIPANNGIDKIQGLAFTNLSTGNLCLDWAYNLVWLNGNMTIPNLQQGQVVTIVASQENANITQNGTTLSSSGGTYTYHVTEDAPNGLSFHFPSIHIFSITVTDSEYEWNYSTTTANLDGKNRAITGTFTFTGGGTISGGKVIDEVPGITMTVGASGSTWSVVNASNLNGNNLGAAAAYCAYAAERPAYTSGCFFKFNPTVNGELKVKYYSNNEVYYAIGEVPGDRQSSGSGVFEKTFMLEAGKTYYLGGKGGGFYLNSYTFRPVFFNPGTTTDQLTLGNFSAGIGSPAKDGFPKLINPTSAEQQNKVKFAGNKDLVFLYKNNDVEILDGGSNILIRGTVLDKKGDDGLVAYYYLNASVLKLESEYEDQAYITGFNVATGYAFTNANSNNNDKPMELVNGSTISVQKDGDTPYSVTPQFSTYKWAMYVPITLQPGATYRITIPAGSIKETATGALNAEMVRTFTVKADGELEVKMIYPTGIATVGTAIILETSVNGATNGLVLDTKKRVTGVLSAAGEESMELEGIDGENQLAFKPTRTLSPNTVYTLTITYNADNNVITSDEYNGKIYQVTHTRVFTFRTGSSAGSTPLLVRTTPVEGDNLNAAVNYNGGTISFTFDQVVELEPYSTVKATPINGSEATANGVTRALGYAGNTLTVGEDGKTVSLNYEKDGLKYDLYYQVVIPVNTVVGAGGQPNSEPIILKFKMGKNPNATEVDAGTFYPHTWDFCKFGNSTIQGTTAYNVVNDYGDPGSNSGKRINSLVKSSGDGYTIYTTKNQDGFGFDQGNDVYFNCKSGKTDEMDEFDGIRLSLVNARSNRFELRNVTSKTRTKNADGTDMWVFRMNGNTHYMTLSNVPAGKLYMVVNSPYIGINSPNATFEDGDYELSNDKTLLNTKGTMKKVVVSVAEAGDVSFCVKNFNCEKIAVAVTEGKTIGSTAYATDSWNYDIRYELTNAFTQYNVEGYYIEDNGYDTSSTSVSSTQVKVSEGGTGVILKRTTDAGSNYCLFKTDVNSAKTLATKNLLKGNPSDSPLSIARTEGDNTNYVFTNLYYTTDKSGNIVAGTTQQGSSTATPGFYKVVNGGGSLGAHKAYLQLPTVATADAKSFVFFNFDGVAASIAGAGDGRAADTGFYTLSGTKTAHPARKGIYIKSGKKFVVK